MDLFLLRHGKAFKRSPKFKPDSIRPLTPEGEEEMHKVSRGIKRLGLDFELILTSPWVRAARTAEIFHDVTKIGMLETSDALVGDADPAKVVQEINAKYSKYDSIVLVGHDPHMSRLLSILLSGRPDMSIDFKKAGFCKLEIGDLKAGKCACLKWLMTPKQLVRMAKDA
jgi:phosphohistidine phosphatase